jgi:hypothetical protein
VGRAEVGRSLHPAAVADAAPRATDLRGQLEAIPVVTVRDAEEKARLNAEADATLVALRTVADLVVGCALRAELAGQPSPEDQIAASAPLVAAALDVDEPEELRDAALAQIESRALQSLDAGRPEVSPHRHPLHWPLAFPEVFVDRGRAGFHALVGNPPFLGGQRITGAAGTDFRSYCVRWLAGGQRGSADLVTYFFRRAVQVAAGFGFLSTNTISQGDTREVGLDQLTANGWTIHRAVKSTPWPGEATLEIAKVWMRQAWSGRVFLGEAQVTRITPSLDPAGRVSGAPHRLAAYGGVSFQGSNILGAGFLMPPDDARRILELEPEADGVVVPAVNGDDVNSSPTQTASRWAINFRDWALERAARFPLVLAIVEQQVRPERERNTYSSHARHHWWQYERPRVELYETIAAQSRVLVMAATSKTVQPVFVAGGQVFTHALYVFAYDDDFHFGLLTSAFHWWWAVTYGSTMRTDLRYTPTDCFETFPQPSYDAGVEAAGKALDEHRSALMIRNDEGLTKTYNRVHHPDDNSPGIADLRELHVALDLAVRDAYGWSDLDLDHGFHDTPQGRRFTLGPAARTEVLDRLLELNHARYAEEVAAGLHDKKPTAKGRKRKPNDDAPTLL